jgi:hypothetical protein
MIANIVKHGTGESLPIYQHSEVSRNDDGTYKVEHTFLDKAGHRTLLRYPKVEIKIDPTISVFERFPCVFPYGVCRALPYGESEELFTLELER